jgi:hypothetical protein
LDYEAEWENLQKNINPFAIIVMAHLKTKATTGKPEERERWKWNIVRGLYEKGYEREKIIKLFQVIDRMMTLPQELVQSFEERLNRYEEETRMPLLSNMELRGMERGLEQGLEQGTRQTARDSVITVLRVRFGEVPTQLTDTLNNIEDLPLLKQLLERAVNVNSMTEFQQFIVTE